MCSPFKIIFAILIFLITIHTGFITPITLAQGYPATLSSSGHSHNRLITQANPPEDASSQFLPSYPSEKDGGKISYVAKLPSGSWQNILTSVIKFILAITGTLALISFTYAGILLATARGEEDQISKAKNLILWSIAALGIIAVSYAVVYGVSQFKFFS